MADKKISQLTALSAANLAPSTDVLAIVDTSATETKKIVAQDLVNGVLNVASAVGIGTASPAYKLDVNGNAQVGNATAATNRFLYINGVANKAGAVAFQESGVNRWLIGNGAASENGNFEIYDATNGNNFILTRTGNLGLGVTPSAWTSINAFQVGPLGAISGNSSIPVVVSGNAYATSAGWAAKYITSGYATAYLQYLGEHRWLTAPSWNGTGSDVVSFTQAMTLTAGGNLLVGTTTDPGYGAGYTAFVLNNSTVPIIDLQVGGTRTLSLLATSTNPTIKTVTNVPLIFGTNDTERGRFSAGGDFLVGTTGNTRNGLVVYYASSDTVNAHSGNASGSSNSLYTGWYGATSTTAGTLSFNVTTNGNVTNTNGSYGTISDARLKQDIVDAGSQWDDLKSIRFRKYRMKTDVEANPDAPAMFGVVAQELAQVCPGLVDEHIDRDGEITKTVKSSILLMKAAKALQEAMARIESLEAKVAALEAK